MAPSADRTHQTLLLPDGRTLGFAEYGPHTAGKTVLYFNGSGGSRLEYPPDPTILPGLDIRLVATDRPGHGLSSPQPGRTLLDWPKDMACLADYLNLARCYLLGWSAGGPHALACAHQLHPRIGAAAIISGLGPPDRPHPYAGLPLPTRLFNLLARKFPALVALFRRRMVPIIMGDPQEAGKKLASFFPPVDRRIALRPEVLNILVASLQEGHRQGWQGVAQDDTVINQPFGFRLEEIPVRVDIWQGELDANVPRAQAEYQHSLLPNSTLTILPGQGHLYLFDRWRDVLQKLCA